MLIMEIQQVTINTYIWQVFLFGTIGGKIKIAKIWDSLLQFPIQLHNKHLMYAHP